MSTSLVSAVVARRPLAAAIGLVLSGSVSMFANAEDAPRQLSKVVTQADATDNTDIKIDKASSPKLTAPLLDTPQTIAVISKEVLAQQGVGTLSAALRNTPGITMQLGENGNTAAGDTFSLRGSSTQTNIFVDGMRDLGAVTRDTFNVEQIEVVKGPAGADTGRGIIAGYVNLVSKAPTLDSYTTASASWNTANNERVTGDTNVALGSHSALRLNVMGQDGQVAGRDYIKNKSWGVAPSFAAGLGTDTRVYVYGMHTQQDNIPDGGVPTIGLQGFYNAAFAAGGANAGVTPAAVDSRGYYGRYDDFEKIRADLFTVRIDHDFGNDVTLHNNSRYGKNRMQRILTGIGYNATTGGLIVTSPDPAAWQVLRTRQGTFQNNEIITNQTNLTAAFKTGVLQHSLSSGVEFIREQQYTPTYTGLGTLPNANLYHPDREDAFTDVYGPRPGGAYSRGSTNTVAAYVFDTVQFTEQWRLNAGVRVERYNTAFDQVQLSTAAAQPSLPVGTPIPTSLSKDGNLLSWRLGLIYKPVANGTFYVSYATAKTPPGSANFTLNSTLNSDGKTLNVNNPNLDPQNSTNIEVGTKWDVLDTRLGITLAVYRSDNDNVIGELDASTNSVTQYGKQRVQGAELNVVGNLTDAWQLTAGVAYTDTEVVEGAATGNNAQGASLRWTPPWSGTLWTSYRLPYGFDIGAGAIYMGKQQRVVDPTVNLSTSNMPYIPSYWVVDAMAGYELSKHAKLQLNVYNLFDKTYIATLNNSGARYVPGAPRQAQLTLSVQF